MVFRHRQSKEEVTMKHLRRDEIEALKHEIARAMFIRFPHVPTFFFDFKEARARAAGLQGVCLLEAAGPREEDWLLAFEDWDEGAPVRARNRLRSTLTKLQDEYERDVVAGRVKEANSALLHALLELAMQYDNHTEMAASPAFESLTEILVRKTDRPEDVTGALDVFWAMAYVASNSSRFSSSSANERAKQLTARASNRPADDGGRALAAGYPVAAAESTALMPDSLASRLVEMDVLGKLTPKSKNATLYIFS